MAKELLRAEQYWVLAAQKSCFSEEMGALKAGGELSGSKLLPLHLFLDKSRLLQVGGRISLSDQQFDKCHPLILPGTHHLTRLLVEQEHRNLLDVGPTLVVASLSRRFWISGARRMKRTITRKYVRCR